MPQMFVLYTNITSLYHFQQELQVIYTNVNIFNNKDYVSYLHETADEI